MSYIGEFHFDLSKSISRTVALFAVNVASKDNGDNFISFMSYRKKNHYLITIAMSRMTHCYRSQISRTFFFAIGLK